MRDDDQDLVPLDPQRLPAAFVAKVLPDADFFVFGGLIVVVRAYLVNGVPVELRFRLPAARVVDEPEVAAKLVNDGLWRLGSQVLAGQT